jgi:prepilin-type N-terminal cleavage/methylation domain-containing protein
MTDAMRNQSKPTQGFTLVELLIVIAIIAVLAALGFAGIQTALKKSKTVQTLNLANNLNRAIQNFYDEYGSFPQETVLPTPITTATGAEGVQVLLVLLAQETAASPLNKRGVRFLEPTQAKGKKGGLDYNVGSTVPTAMYDAWGEPFYIAFDDDYNDEIENEKSHHVAATGNDNDDNIHVHTLHEDC